MCHCLEAGFGVGSNGVLSHWSGWYVKLFLAMEQEKGPGLEMKVPQNGCIPTTRQKYSFRKIS